MPSTCTRSVAALGLEVRCRVRVHFNATTAATRSRRAATGVAPSSSHGSPGRQHAYWLHAHFRPGTTIAHMAAQEVMGCIFGLLHPRADVHTPYQRRRRDRTNNRSSHGLSTRRGEGSGRDSKQEGARDYHEARGSGAGPSRACCRKPLMNSRSSTAMPSSDAASSGAPDDASSAESESDTDTADAAARAGGRGAGAVARGARGRRAGSSIVANDSTAGSRE